MDLFGTFLIICEVMKKVPYHIWYGIVSSYIES